ncbi:MAG: DUF362 domain-containing protein [Chloroflexi bacterium]|nr:DUF362 domain-containing protein [Chloroflexota bacterium]
MNEIDRREFIRRMILLALGATAASSGLARCGSPSVPTAAPTIPPLATATPMSTLPAATAAGPTPTGQPPAPATGDAYLAVARGDSPTALVQAAIRAIGGIERFVKPGADVIIKPNICVAYHGPEYAATTNPEVVGALVALCLGAGARRVRVMDNPFGGSPEAAYARSGVADAVKAAGGQMEIMSEMKYATAPIPQGKDLKQIRIYRDALDADVFINVPIAKDHGLARLTLGMKNLLGVIWDRPAMHRNMGQRIAELTSLVRPTLTVVDAVRILMANGPTGGNLADVKQTNTIIASADIVAADAYATSLFGLTPTDVSYIPAAAKMGLGTMDLAGVRVEEIGV